MHLGSSTSATIEDKQDYIYVKGDDELRKYFDSKDLNIFRNTELFAVTGKLKNNDTHTWDRINLHMEYYVDDIHIGSCYRRTINIIKPGELKLFKINCRFIEPLTLPDGFSYRIKFDSARKILN
ncbi:MAG: hypothetical protein GTO02_13800 [Candidatus Dadabacteria bacterium]|nr:hypothetical protein [Candidatus Dadabacteria bacterium]